MASAYLNSDEPDSELHKLEKKIAKVEQSKPQCQGAYHAHVSKYISANKRKVPTQSQAETSHVVRLACVEAAEKFQTLGDDKTRLYNELAKNNIKLKKESNAAQLKILKDARSKRALVVEEDRQSKRGRWTISNARFSDEDHREIQETWESREYDHPSLAYVCLLRSRFY